MIELEKFASYAVLWQDAASDDGWTDLKATNFKKLEKQCRHTTRGTLVHQTKNTVFLASTYNAEVKRYLGLLILPKGMILKIRKLR